MQFALVYSYDPTKTSPTEAEFEDWMKFDAAVRADGVFVHEAGFHSRDEAKVVSVTDGATEVTDGPAAPAAYTVAGYYVVDVGSIDKAAEIAVKIPTASYGYVKVRQVVEL